jgi:2-polyprenyl-3-methyl-5-hydroxy-6-metoxy-1,4-benzoquinol methylase
MNSNLVNYYKDRAKEYEKIYLKPERQEDIKKATAILQNLFYDKEVFEIACGTGFWTERIALTSKQVWASDINETVVEIACSKEYAKQNVVYAIADIYAPKSDQVCESLFGGFIYSHILKQELERFFKTIHSFVKPGGLIVLMDNNFVEGSSTAISETDKEENTYQIRKLADGSAHRVLKNFPDETFLREALKDLATGVNFISLDYFWILTYKPLIIKE